MSTVTPSRILDIDSDELTVESVTSTPKVCTWAMIYTRFIQIGQPDKAIEIIKQGDICGAVATHSVIPTCCDGPPVFRCSDHASSFEARITASVCIYCLHMCWPDKCLHRLILPL